MSFRRDTRARGEFSVAIKRAMCRDWLTNSTSALRVDKRRHFAVAPKIEGFSGKTEFSLAPTPEKMTQANQNNLQLSEHVEFAT